VPAEYGDAQLAPTTELAAFGWSPPSRRPPDAIVRIAAAITQETTPFTPQAPPPAMACFFPKRRS
jgi:hypothetical protein